MLRERGSTGWAAVVNSKLIDLQVASGVSWFRLKSQSAKRVQFLKPGQRLPELRDSAVVNSKGCDGRLRQDDEDIKNIN